MRVLLTGMSGTGKSALVQELRRRGHAAHDADDGFAERLRTRTGNAYGRDDAELAQVLGDLESVEPMLRRSADLVMVTIAPVAELADALLRQIAVLDAGDGPEEQRRR